MHQALVAQALSASAKEAALHHRSPRQEPNYVCINMGRLASVGPGLQTSKCKMEVKYGKYAQPYVCTKRRTNTLTPSSARIEGDKLPTTQPWKQQNPNHSKFCKPNCQCSRWSSLVECFPVPADLSLAATSCYPNATDTPFHLPNSCCFQTIPGQSQVITNTV